MNNKLPVCLSIAGLDPSGGAGIIADIKTFSAHRCYGAAVVTSVTFQNTMGVFGSESQSASSVVQQTQPIFDDFVVDAMKTGMLPTREVIEAVAGVIEKNKVEKVVVDPVVRSTSGFDLIDDAALQAMIELLFPLALLVTPNVPEANRISGIEIRSESDFDKVAARLRELGARNVLLKGGHFDASSKDERIARDFLYLEDTKLVLEGRYFETTATHGTGCTLAAAITANLACGKSLETAVRDSKTYVNEAIRTAPGIGKGHSPINQLLNSI